MRRTRYFFVAAMATTSLLAMAGNAAAASTRYATATGGVTSGTCPQGTPCRLDFAISGAGTGDTVRVAPGNYTVSYPVAATAGITVMGEPGQARPRIVGDGARTASTIVMNVGGTLKHVYAESTAAYPAVETKGAVIEDVIAYSAAGTAIQAKAGGSATIRDTVAHTVSTAAPALTLTDDQLTGTLDIANVTAVAEGAGSTGIEHGSGSPTTIVNSIARGASFDIKLNGIVAAAVVSYSNFRPGSSTGVTPGLGNVSGAPIFADADLRPDASSPTVDAGTAATALLGTIDPDGNLRTLGAAPDIGAYEWIASAGGGSGGSGGSADPTGTGDGTPAGTLPPAAPPVLGKKIGVGTKGGTVTVQVPGSSEPVVLTDDASVPVGSVIDATHGVVTLTSVRDKTGKIQTGQFWGGAFKVTQSRKGAYTDLALVGPRPQCGVRNKVSAARKW